MTAFLRSQWRKVSSGGGVYYHLADKVDFRLDPTFHPQNNTTIGGDWSEPGIFVSDSPEHWLNGYGYWRPWVIEFRVSAGVGKDWGREKFIPATEFDRITLTRVLPLDGYCREEYGDWGWTEDHFKTDYLTGEPIEGIGSWPRSRPSVTSAPDARQLDPSWRAAYTKRVQEFGKQRGGVYV